MTERKNRRRWWHPILFRFHHDPRHQLINREFDEADDEEIEAISAEIGASGARRPPSE